MLLVANNSFLLFNMVFKLCYLVSLYVSCIALPILEIFDRFLRGNLAQGLLLAVSVLCAHPSQYLTQPNAHKYLHIYRCQIGVSNDIGLPLGSKVC